MKPELSFAATASLPRDFANAKARRNVSAEVVTVRTTSTSGISGTGLKKWSPTKRSPRWVAAAIAAIVRLDVFEAKMAAGPHRPSSSFHRAFLSSRSSVTARALSQTCWDTSRTVVSYPATAATWAIPLPMSPQPSTPTRLMSVMSRSGDFERLSDLIRDAEERVRLLARQGALGLDLAALEPVEHLIQSDLNLLVLQAVGAQRRHRRGPEGQERHVRERGEHADGKEGGGRGGAHAQQRCRDAEALSADVAQIREQRDVTEAALERSHLAGDLRRPREGEAAAPRSERPLNGGERPDLGLPARVVGVASLHLEQFFLLHPRVERALHRGRVPRDHALGCEAPRAQQPTQHAAALFDGGACPLFEQRLPQVARGNSHVGAEREHVRLGQPLPDVPLAGLQFRRALDDALERVAADELARHRYASAFVFFGSAGTVSPDVRSGSAGTAGFRVTASKNPLSKSIGIGKNVVELFSEEISVTVCR